MKKYNILITGGAGYVGAMILDQFAKNNNVENIIVIDKENKDELFESVLANYKDKIFFVHKNLADKSWIEDINVFVNQKRKTDKSFVIDVVIHTAWQIRAMYGKSGHNTTWDWNVNGSDNVFDFVFQNNINKLIYFSTVASYGSFKDNTLDYQFTENDDFRKTDYIYAEEKKATEEHLQTRYLRAKNNNYTGQIIILRPAAISGPRGRYGRIRFGLQANLQGKIKGGIVMKIIKLLTTYVPATKKWVRQFIHEDDVVNIVKMLSIENDKLQHDYNVYNICPLGDSVLPKDMAQAVNKKILKIHPQMARIAFYFFWHITRGKVPTSRGSWKGYSYPIVVSGEKLIKDYKYNYKYSCKEAFTTKDGVYSFYCES